MLTKITEILGQRIRSYRKSSGLSQEQLAELADLHPTYIGQLERGEKNASIETLARISHALHVPMTQLLEKLDEYNVDESITSDSGTFPLKTESIALEAYELISMESLENQKKLLKLLTYALMLKN